MMKKHLMLLAPLAAVVAGRAPAQAQPTLRPKLVPNDSAKTTLDSKIGVSSVLNKEKIGERYRLDMSFAPGSIDDDGDHVYECYGTLKINGVIWWEMPRSTSDRGAQKMGGYFVPNNETVIAPKYGYSLTKSNVFNKGRKFEFDALDDNYRSNILKISLRLYDADTYVGSKDLSKDDLFGKYDITVDFTKMKGGDYYWFWKDGNGNDSNFYLHITPVKTLYGTPDNSSLPKIDTKPMKEKPKIPGKVPVPILRGAPMRRTG